MKKMSILKCWACLAVLLVCTEAVLGQNGANIQPTIMVIPFTREGEDLRQVLDRDANRRIAITKVKEGFDNRGFTTVDFVGKLKEIESRQVLTSEEQTDFKTVLVEYSGADIYVETDVVLNRSQTGNSASVILSGYEASTGNSLSNKVGSSNKFHTEDFAKLTEKATEGIIEDFLNVMNAKFSEIVANGKFVTVEFNFSPESMYDMTTEVGEDGFALADALEIWMGENAANGYYHIQGITDKKVLFDQVRIPLKDEAGRNYSASRFSLEVLKFCNRLNPSEDASASLKAKRIVKNGTIIITFQ